MPEDIASRNVAWQARLLRFAFSVLAGSAFALAALAEQALVDAEPNDTPQTATEFSAPMRLMGTMPSGDQDAWLWTVSDEDAGRRWSLELMGLPGLLTIVEVLQLEYTETGEVAQAGRLLRLGSRDGQRPAMSEGLIFEPGEYLLGMARSGGSSGFRPVDGLAFGAAGSELMDGAPADVVSSDRSTAYRLFITEASRLPPSGGATPNTRAEAIDIRPNRERAVLFADGEPAWYRIELSEAQASSRWDVDVQVPVGRRIEARLHGDADQPLLIVRNDEDGKATLADISLPAGAYHVEVRPLLSGTAEAGFVQTLMLTETGQRVAGSEAEPNDRWALANHSDDEACCTGQIGTRTDRDFFRFTFAEEDLETLLKLVVETATDQQLDVCLLDNEGASIQCRRAMGTVRMNDLLLAPGTFGVSVAGRTEGVEYRLGFEAAGPIEPGRESEPNDKLAYAVGTPENNRIKGAFDGRDDVDFYRFVIDDEPQLWRVMVVGENIADIEYRDSIGALNQRLEAAPDQRRVSLENLFLLPGTHHIAVSGRAAGDYTLLARKLGPPDPNGELEPNDDESRMQTLRIGQTRTGLLSNPKDTDLYRFHLAGWDNIRLAINPPADGKLAAELYHDGMRIGAARRTDGELVLTGLFPPGDYRLVLAPREVSDAEYELSLTRGDRYVCADDCEPNNNPVFAGLFPASGILRGRSGDWDDLDWYVLPASPAARAASFVVDRRNDLRVYDADLNNLNFTYDQEAGAFRGTLAAGERHFLHVGRRIPDDYEVTLLLGDADEPPAAVAVLSAELSLQLASTSVTPYEVFGQQVSGGLSIRNTGTLPLDLALEATTSDARWHMELAADAVSLSPGAIETVGVSIVAPPDVWGGMPVRISARAVAEDGRFVSQSVDLAVDPDGQASNPVHAWHIPPGLRGGINVARGAFGAGESATPMPTDLSGIRLAELFNGRAVIGQGPSFKGNRGTPQQVTVKLAGDRPVPVAGFALNPLYRDFKHRTPRDLVFQLSADGETFDTVLRGQLTTMGTDQYFVLDAPVPATHARLLLTTNWFGELDGPLTLGEWKVIAADGFDPAGEEGRNIGRPEFGGHVVWSKPTMRGRHASLLTPEDEKLGVQLPDDVPLEWVIGFHHERAAKIAQIGWLDTVVSGENIDALTLSVSMESPVGPWAPVATWSRTEAPDGFTPAAPFWARYLRFSVAPDPSQPNVNLPETITIREAPTGEDYRSVLSEWGVNSRSAFYESLQPVPVREGLRQRGNESRVTAEVLNSGQQANGQVKLLEQSQWYRPQLPAGDNTLILTVTGEPTVRTELALTSAAGEPVVLRKNERDSRPNRHVFEAYVAAETADLFLEVREPPRSVMFMWDTSPSIGRYRPMIYKSLLAYAEDLVPEVDTANLLPFGAGSPLLDEWYGEPYLMQLILNDHARREGSSAAEFANYTGTRALKDRPGTKAIVTITDAETSAYPKMWEGMKDVQPRVFSMHVGPEAPAQDLMQSWSSVNGGHYAHVIHENEMEIAFERAATMMRRPAHYTLALQTDQRKAPGPGYLHVVSGDNAPARGAVELILDASGSMLQRMEGRRRIEVAKEVLTTAITEQIPAGTPTALRVFGHRTPNACETDQEIPLGPLDVAAATGRIAAIQAKNLARTPIADSLAAVRGDLRGVEGAALIVLVTDGEETCDGDPAAVIENLRNSGVELSLNIVGFAIDDEQLASEFAAWAEAGGGRYLAANDTATLADSVEDALATPYVVFDANEDTVAEGQLDGEPVELKPGVYRVVVHTSPVSVSTVEIQSDSTYKLVPSE